MKLTKILYTMFAATTIMAMVGCSSSDEISGNSEDVVLSVNIWDAYQQPGIQQILNEFTAETGIKTSLSMITWSEYWSVLEAGAQGGQLPDVFWMHSNESQRYMENDMLLDLTDQIAESTLIDPANYPDDIWDLYISDKKYYAVPKDIDTIALWYNKTMFDAAGIEYPNEDWTWDDMTQAARKLTKADGSQYGIAMRNDTNQEGYYNILYSNGGRILNEDKTKSMLDDPKTIEGMEVLETWINEGLMPSLATMSETPAEVLMQSGQVAMALHGSWMLPSYKTSDYALANIDIAELPKSAATGDRVSVYNGLGWAAAANTEHPEEAWKLVEYLGSEKAQLRQAELGVTMSAFTGTSDAWINSSDFNLQAYINMMDNMVIRPYSRNTVIWENDNNEALKAVYTGDETMEEALKKMAAEMNETLENE
ncbi:sugar ABC transporter substrate-binding protein [Candidatus Epulopiscium viviparus]|uniref:ABC transporter substrate-binding protein n=1 Tax=Candidatus Epulonipiscium viviparus TaxID=420336 RepID=UPI002ED06F88